MKMRMDGSVADEDASCWRCGRRRKSVSEGICDLKGGLKSENYLSKCRK